MYCENCGNTLKQNAKFCSSCGNNLQHIPSKYKFNGRLIVLMIIFLLTFVFYLTYFKQFRILINTNLKRPSEEVVVNNLKDKKIITAELTGDEIKKISQAVVSLECLYDNNDDGEWDNEVYGSGTYIHKCLIDDNYSNDIFKFSDGIVLTNGHVAPLKKTSTNKNNFNFCTVQFSDKNLMGNFGRMLGHYSYDKHSHILNDQTDLAILHFKNSKNSFLKKPYYEDNVLNTFVLKNLAICNPEKIIGSKVYIFGYPSSTFEYVSGNKLKKEVKGLPIDDDTKILMNRNLVITEGIISGKSNDKHNYYTDAKIDAGNSGGLAVSKINGKICFVGIPTWVSQGEYENMGMIQPFSSRMLDSLKIMLE